MRNTNYKKINSHFSPIWAERAVLFSRQIPNDSHDLRLIIQGKTYETNASHFCHFVGLQFVGFISKESNGKIMKTLSEICSVKHHVNFILLNIGRKTFIFLQGKIPFNFGMLVVLAVGFRIVGYFALLAKTFRKSS